MSRFKELSDLDEQTTGNEENEKEQILIQKSPVEGQIGGNFNEIFDLFAPIPEKKHETDPRPDLAGDSQFWIKLFRCAGPGRAATILYNLRRGGARLVETRDYYRITPGEWDTERYKKAAKLYLEPYKDEITKLLFLARTAELVDPEEVPSSLRQTLERKTVSTLEQVEDPRPDLAGDHDLWAVVLKEAFEHYIRTGKGTNFNNVYANLHGMRCGGAVLIRTPEGKLALRPGEWEKEEGGVERYRQMAAKYLEPFKDEVIEVFKRAGEALKSQSEKAGKQMKLF